MYVLHQYMQSVYTPTIYIHVLWSMYPHSTKPHEGVVPLSYYCFIHQQASICAMQDWIHINLNTVYFSCSVAAQSTLQDAYIGYTEDDYIALVFKHIFDFSTDHGVPWLVVGRGSSND